MLIIAVCILGFIILVSFIVTYCLHANHPIPRFAVTIFTALVLVLAPLVVIFSPVCSYSRYLISAEANSLDDFTEVERFLKLIQQETEGSHKRILLFKNFLSQKELPNVLGPETKRLQGEDIRYYYSVYFDCNRFSLWNRKRVLEEAQEIETRFSDFVSVHHVDEQRKLSH